MVHFLFILFTGQCQVRYLFVTFLQLLNPFAPHMTEEIWSIIGEEKEISQTPWPKYDESKIITEKVVVVVQVNGKLRARLEVDVDTSQDQIKQLAFDNENINNWFRRKRTRPRVENKTKHQGGKNIFCPRKCWNSNNWRKPCHWGM